MPFGMDGWWGQGRVVRTGGMDGGEWRRWIDRGVGMVWWGRVEDGGMEVSIAVVQRVAAVVISQRITVLSDVRRSGESLRGRCP